MRNIFGKSLKSTFSILFLFQVALIFICATLLLVLYNNQIHLAQSRDKAFASYLLADELRRSSDDLTVMARAFVATGDEKFAGAYKSILDIRNGKRPRPVEYNRIYWDFVSATGTKPRPDGATIALREQMVQAGFTSGELDKLNLAQQNSDDLTEAEEIAMNAKRGLFADVAGSYTIQKTPDHELANRLVNDENYYRDKAEVMRPIDDFYQLFQTRTRGEVNSLLKTSNLLFWVIICLSVFLVTVSIASFVFLRRQISRHEQTEKDLRDLKEILERKVNERTKKLTQSEAEAQKALDEAERLNKLMVGRELTMIELKKEINRLKTKQEN
jgi:methyl-accepting chemotaxis protein